MSGSGQRGGMSQGRIGDRANLRPGDSSLSTCVHDANPMREEGGKKDVVTAKVLFGQVVLNTESMKNEGAACYQGNEGSVCGSKPSRTTQGRE